MVENDQFFERYVYHDMYIKSTML